MLRLYSAVERLGKRMQNWARERASKRLLKLVPPPRPTTWLDAYFPIPVNNEYEAPNYRDNLGPFTGL